MEIQYGPTEEGLALSLDKSSYRISFSTRIGKRKYATTQEAVARIPGERADSFRTRAMKMKMDMQETARSADLSSKGLVARTIDDLVASYLTHPVFEATEPLTKRRYQQHIAKFTTWCNKEGISAADSFDQNAATRFQSYLIKYPHAPKTVNCILAVPKLIFKVESERTEVENDPFRFVRTLKEDDDAEIRDLSKEELDAFLGMANEWQYHVFTIFYYTGMRTKELRYLPTYRISSDLSTIRIISDKEIGFKVKAKGSTRYIPCHPAVRPSLEYFLKLNKGKTFLIGGEKGEDEPVHQNRFYKNYEHIVRRVERTYPHLRLSDTSPHNFRKTCGSHMFQNGAAIEAVSVFLGHESVTLTRKIYAHLLLSNLVKAVGVLPGVEVFVETLKTKYPQHYVVQ